MSLKQYLAKDVKKKRYYTPKDISVHNQASDCWVVLFYNVFNLSNLIQENIQKEECIPLIKNAGKDISYWFDESTGEPKTQIDVKTGQKIHYTPIGTFLDLDKYQDKNVWWKNQNLIQGQLTKCVRKIRIINMLTDHDDIIEVPCEETIQEILERYKEINKHADSYTWKRMGRPLDMQLTLDENDIPDETQEFQKLDIPEDQWYIPAIHLYFNDDLTVA